MRVNRYNGVQQPVGKLGLEIQAVGETRLIWLS